MKTTGDVSVLHYGDYPLPTVGNHDVLVKVMATSISGWDVKYRRGDLFEKNEHTLPGRTQFPLPQQLG